MLATLLIWLSVAVAVLALLDLFLSKAQKTWLSNVVIKAWNILDEARRWSFLDWLKNPRARWWLALSLALVLGLVFNVWQIFLLESSEGFFLLTVAVISISFVIFDVYRLRCKLDDYLLRFTLPKDLLLKLVIRSLGMGGAYALALIAAYYE